MSRKMLVALTAVLVGCPKTGSGDEIGGLGVAPSLAQASGLSCYLQGVEDGPNYQLAVTGGTVSGLKLDIDINGETVATYAADDFAVSSPGEPPLATYTGTLDGRQTTLILAEAVSPEQRFAHYRGSIDGGAGQEALLCYRF